MHGNDRPQSGSRAPAGLVNPDPWAIAAGDTREVLSERRASQPDTLKDFSKLMFCWRKIGQTERGQDASMVDELEYWIKWYPKG